MRIVRRGEGKAMTWRNGRGVTTEIAVSPEGAGYDEFIWRISIATSEDESALSTFPGVDRTVVMMDDHGVMLDFGAGTITMGFDCAPLTFPGEAPVALWMMHGPSQGLNVMTRRRHAHHRMEVIRVSEDSVLPAGCSAVVCRSGAVGLNAQMLHPFDAALLPAGQVAPRIGGSGEIVAIVIAEVDDAASAADDFPDGFDPGLQIDAPPDYRP